jgi:polyphosphate:AMP phosphotransferase
MSLADTLFADAESDPTVTEREYRERSQSLRTALLLAQHAMVEQAERAVLLVVAGLDGVGKGSSINLLNEWMDPRHLRTLVFEPHVAKGRPALWPYWERLPARGSLAVVFGSWYQPLFQSLLKQGPDHPEVHHLIERIRHFEAMLVAEKVQVIKLWYHLSRKAQKSRTERLLSDPATAWRVMPADRRVARHFKPMRRAGAYLVQATDAPHAPWTIIPSAQGNYRDLATGDAVLSALQRPLPHPSSLRTSPPSPHAGHGIGAVPSLDAIDHSTSLPREDYETLLAHSQRQLALKLRHPDFAKRSLVLVFEGPDAAGKGGAIRRVIRAMDIRQVDLHPVAAPSDEERARPYLWRFWRRLPPIGKVAIFDRSWYGRVLVERVEALAAPEDWQRAYDEINDFEQQLVESGSVVVKIWLSITADEQLARFREREESPFKTFKITPEDWRNRNRWDDYHQAANEMFARTHTPWAPWTVIPANCKRHARVAVLQAITQALDSHPR